MSLHRRLQSLNVEAPAPGGPGTHGSSQGTDSHDEANDPFVELKTKIHKLVIQSVGPALFRSERAEGAASSRNELEHAVHDAVNQIIEDDATPLTRQERNQLIQEITDDILGYGPIDPFLRDDAVSEVMVNDHKTFYI
jgi:pilus assembly protein CpaF